MFFLSCTKDDSNEGIIKQQAGDVWLSGGLAFCAEQIHLDNGDTLIVNLDEIIFFRTGDRVMVKYKELGISGSCSPGIDCEIVDIKRIE